MMVPWTKAVGVKKGTHGWMKKKKINKQALLRDSIWQTKTELTSPRVLLGQSEVCIIYWDEEFQTLGQGGMWVREEVKSSFCIWGGDCWPHEVWDTSDTSGWGQCILLNLCSKSSQGKQKQISVDCLVRLRGSIELYEIKKWVNV